MFTDEPSCNLQHAAFLCFKVLLVHLQENHERNKELILLTLFNLMGCFSSLQMKRKSRENIAALQYNVKHLLINIYKCETGTECPVLIVIKTLAVHRDFDQYDVILFFIIISCDLMNYLQEMVSVISDLDCNVYTNFCWWVTEGLISNHHDFRMYLPNITMPLIVHTHSNFKQDKKDTLIEVLILNLIKLCGDTKFEIAESAIKNLEMVILLNDNSVKNAIKVSKKN